MRGKGFDMFCLFGLRLRLVCEFEIECEVVMCCVNGEVC